MIHISIHPQTDEFHRWWIALQVPLFVYFLFSMLELWEYSNHKDSEENINILCKRIKTMVIISWFCCGLMPDKCHFFHFVCNVDSQWCIIHNVSAFDLPPYDMEDTCYVPLIQCCGSFESFNERDYFLSSSWQWDMGFILLFGHYNTLTGKNRVKFT